MRIHQLFGIIFISLFMAASSQASGTVVHHTVSEAETPWFLATLYYGKGQDFTKLLSFNHLQRAEDMKEGMKIRIENPRYVRTSPGFSERYAKLWELRQKALGLSTGSSLPNAKVVIPSEQIRNQDKTPQLPFTEVRELASKSPADLAREEVEKSTAKKGH